VRADLNPAANRRQIGGKKTVAVKPPAAIQIFLAVQLDFFISNLNKIFSSLSYFLLSGAIPRCTNWASPLVSGSEVRAVVTDWWK
jgi:hypothetical protein